MSRPDETAHPEVEPAGTAHPDDRDDHTGGVARAVVRWLLVALLGFAGVGHFTAAEAFRAQVPTWMPWPEAVILVSGLVELALAAALAFAPRRHRPLVGWVVAAFFVAVFPGNVSQYLTGTTAFGLDTDTARLVRLLFQPGLVVAALWSTGAWATWRRRRGGRQT